MTKKLTYTQLSEVMKQELKCIERQIEGAEEKCDRKCAECDLVMDDKTLLQAYGQIIALLDNLKELQEIFK